MFIFLLFIICLLYDITVTESCIIYYYRICITIVYITASFILPLTRSLSDDPEFACPGWRFEISYCQTCHWIHIGDLSPIRFIGILVLLSYFLAIMLTDLFCRYSCTYLMLELLCIWMIFPVLRLNIRARAFSPCVCTSP